ncbi:MAG: purine phosphorylase [Gammaproteobacteria bacterium]
MNDRGSGATALIAAMRMEARTARPLARCGCRVLVSGVGGVRARTAAEAALAAGASRLLVWGTAGGLVPDLVAGTLLLPAAVFDAEGNRFAVDPEWRSGLLTAVPTDIPLGEAALATAVRPLADSEAKAALAARTGAGAVDMETVAVAAVAAARGAPFAVVRAIADPLELALPSVVLAAVSERFLAPEVALRLLARPSDLSAVRRLAGVMRTARHSLTAFALKLAAMPEASGLY